MRSAHQVSERQQSAQRAVAHIDDPIAAPQPPVTPAAVLDILIKCVRHAYTIGQSVSAVQLSITPG